MSFRTAPSDSKGVSDVNIMGYDLEQTCGACPEQYDVFKDGERVGYLRLRHGYFSAQVPDAGGRTVFEGHPDGYGIFESGERRHYLQAAVVAIAHAR